MKTRVLATLVALAAGPAIAGAETWKNVSVIDTMCLAKVKADPDKHPTACALKCEKGGYGLLTADGTYLKFDEGGNEKTVAALKATKRTDHLRATVEGERKGDQIKVTSLAID